MNRPSVADNRIVTFDVLAGQNSSTRLPKNRAWPIRTFADQRAVG